MNKNSADTHIDRLFFEQKQDLPPFSFNQAVVDVFPDMINRSVPSYQTIIDGIGRIAAKQLSENAQVYDLGCSLGSVSLSIAKHCSAKGVKCTNIRAIDYSHEMVARCKQHLNAFNYSANIEVHQADITEVEFESCDLVVINFTLQFIPVEKRQGIIDKIFTALKPGGILIISEKIRSQISEIDTLLVELHHDFKRENGYSDLEISQKRSALEKVMILDTLETHKGRLTQSGFTKVDTWMQHFNFLSLVAVK
uniref:carboxy-S-adenosyl-L-methionine synthase CmoA n=1 Tax=Ningiella ruwaisensis TaxID=2364274 RepID=UPI0010A06BAD|nr:carboxy-S-adenosyl-L-methionine synthase CmoA [Ningiella ruwaisensis]